MKKQKTRRDSLSRLSHSGRQASGALIESPLCRTGEREQESKQARERKRNHLSPHCPPPPCCCAAAAAAAAAAADCD